MIYLPGDVLLFSRGGVYGRLIQIKTWSRISHCEVVSIGGEIPTIVASRNGIGVNEYEFDPNCLAYVMRPLGFFDSCRANAWFSTVKGQKYDWLGLLAFESARWQGKENGRMFCSEFVVRYLRAGDIDPFNGYDADGIAPGEFLKSSVFTRIDAEVQRA